MKINKSLQQQLGPAVKPYGRRKDQSPELLDGECDDFSELTEDKSTNGNPKNCLNLSVDECSELDKLPVSKKYLWIIDEFQGDLRLRIIPEVTENINRIHKPIVCHSNMTSCNEALQGGECWWCKETQTMYINPKSGRYGAETTKQWEAVKEFFKLIGYSNLIDIT